MQPNAKLSEVVGMHGDSVKIKIKALPVDGEANQEVVRFLAELCEVAKRDVIILNGETNRHKLIEIHSVDEEKIFQKLGLR